MELRLALWDRAILTSSASPFPSLPLGSPLKTLFSLLVDPSMRKTCCTGRLLYLVPTIAVSVFKQVAIPG
jgi:hypothetical protein